MRLDEPFVERELDERRKAARFGRGSEEGSGSVERVDEDSNEDGIER